MRRLLLLVALLALASSATIGFAAGVRLQTRAVSAGASVVAPCDADGISVAPHLAWQGGVVIDRIDVGGIADRCVGLRLTAVLTGQAGAVELGPVPIVASTHNDNRLLIAVPGGIHAAGVDHIHIAIT